MQYTDIRLKETANEMNKSKHKKAENYKGKWK